VSCQVINSIADSEVSSLTHTRGFIHLSQGSASYFKLYPPTSLPSAPSSWYATLFLRSLFPQSPSVSANIMLTPTKKPKRKQKAPQQQQLPVFQNLPAAIQSDVEFEVPQMPHTISVSQSNEELNLRVLRRYDPSIVSIVYIASYAVLYVFSPETQGWEKSGIEGTLFTVHKQPSVIGEDRFGVVILNRRALDTFSAELLDEEDIDITPEYVILKVDDPKPQIYGLWIFCEPPPSSTANARELNAQVILQCAKQAHESRKKAAQRAAEQLPHHDGNGKQPAGMDLISGGGEFMTRQLSLRELLGQNREQDSGFSIHNHHHGQAAAEAPLSEIPAPPVAPPKPQFTTNPDTEFFRAAPRPTPKAGTLQKPPAAPQQTAEPSMATGSIAIDDLFRQAAKANG